MKTNLGEEFWRERYEVKSTGWDIGHISAPLKEYIDQVPDKEIKILIPGCGNAYEAAYLFQNGFTKVTLVDISDWPLKKFQERNPDFPKEQLIHGNFFELNGKFDLVLEQTFFSALDPKLRRNYVRKMKDLLAPGGKLVGVLFDDPLFEDHPPFGGNRDLYLEIFEPEIKVVKMERCYNSVPERAGRELFIVCK
jgi:methyl halide transferase